MSRPRKKGPAHVPPSPEELSNGSYLSCIGCERQWPLRLTVPSLDRCVNCAREWWRMERAARIGSRWKKYGLSRNDVAEMLEAQESECAICARGISMRNCHVDHDHGSGAVRALLCRRCNTSIGHFNDDADLLRKAAQYIERHSGKTKARRPRIMRSIPSIPLRPRKPHHFVTRSGERINLNDPSLIERLKDDIELKRELDAYIAHKIASSRSDQKE